MDDLISRQAAIDALDEIESEVADGYGYQYEKWRKYFCELPSAQPEITRCKDCEHWNLQVGNVKGDGLGSCDFHKVNFVTGEGFCYWADRRGDSDAID